MARQSYPQAYFKAGHLLNADLGGDGKDPGNMTILTARANSQMTAFDNNVKYVLAVLHNLYKEMHQQEDVSTWTYGIEVKISVSAEKWGMAYPDNCIAQSLTATVAPYGQASAFPNGTRAHTLHQTFLKYINFANANGTISNAKPLPQASTSNQLAGEPQRRKRKGTETPSDNARGKRAKAETEVENPLS